MTSSEALLNLLNNIDEPLNKRIKIADNAFNSSEIYIKNKEVSLINWAINSLLSDSKEDAWLLINKWLSSKQFKNLPPNHICNDDVALIIELLQNQLQENNYMNDTVKNHIMNGILHIYENKVFQQFFKYNLGLYFKLLSATLQKLELEHQIIDFLKAPYMFLKIYLVEESFHHNFLRILFPVLISKVFQFKSSTVLFDTVSQLFQKCIFSGNLKKFELFFNHCLEAKIIEKENMVIPKAVFKYMVSTFSENVDASALSFKIIFHGFTQSDSGTQMVAKFLILVAQMLNFDVTDDFKITFPFKIKVKINISKTLKIFLAVLEILITKGFTECDILNISVTEVLRKILNTLLSMKFINSTLYKIILANIAINPLIIEPIASYLLVNIMSKYKEKYNQYYEKVVIKIIEVFAKLHRIENFIAKIIPALKSYFNGENVENKLTMGYKFVGDIETEADKPLNVSISSMFTENILKCFTDSINGLASWQVINVFKTLVYHLNTSVTEYSKKKYKDINSQKFLELLGILNCRLLQSVKIADHTIPSNVISKLIKGLDELKTILATFGSSILTKEHDDITMRTFLNVSYVWGETYMIISYYSMNNEVDMVRVIDNTYSANNLRYLHSYLDVKQWQLVSQRITNFGEQPSKRLLQKLYIQKLRALLLFEESFNNDIITNIVKTLQTDPHDTWRDLLLDKFAVKFILPRMDSSSLIFLSENLIGDDTLHNVHHICDSVTVTNAVTYVTLSKINRLFKNKRKHDESLKKVFCDRMFSLIPPELFFSDEVSDLTERFRQMNVLFEHNESVPSNIQSKEDALLNYIRILKKFPIIYSSLDIQKSFLLYLFLLYEDVLVCSQQIRKEVEDIIIGILQVNKVQLAEFVNIEVMGNKILKYFQRYDVLISLITENAFKNENAIEKFESFVNSLIKNLDDPKNLSSGLLVVQASMKIKKSKMDSTSKEKANQYKEKILKKMSKLICRSDYLIEAYATCLKHYLSMEMDSESSKKLLDKLSSYIQYALENINNENKRGCVILFTTVLHNKQKIKDVEQDIVLKIWNACKKVEIGEEYSHLVKLILTLIPNEDFHLLVKDLLKFTENGINGKNHAQLARQLKTWESVLTCDVNPVKMKVWQEVLEELISKLLDILKNGDFDERLLNSIVDLNESIIQTHHFILSPPLIDMFLMNVFILMKNESIQFETKFNLSISLLEKLLKYRNAMVMDRLPSFLQQYRICLNTLCARSNSDQNGDSVDVSKASDLAHRLEKLTKNLVSNKKDMGRIAVFLIADILERYERINLYPNVKLHLNNCIYSLVSICDHHAISYLMRVLSTASTEMFKILYEHYKKYYMFTGKV